MATTFLDVLKFINHDMTSDERQALVLAINAAQRRLEAQAKADLYVGCPVEWDSKTGRTVKGTVKKVNRRSIHVQETGATTMWRVSPSLLRVVTK